MHLNHLPRFPLAHLPTPVEALPNLTRFLGGANLLIKRDDQTGLAFGGNKTRKLEFLVGRALAEGADTLVTAGAVQSNHCRQTAAAAAKAGLKCELLLTAKKPSQITGNLLLDELFNATIHWMERPQLSAELQELPAQWRAEGRKPHIIPIGGSNGIGAAGYVLAMQELMDQLRTGNQHVDHIVFASSSGGTQAGLTLGARLAGFTGRLHGISIDKGEPEHEAYEEEIAEIANECASYLGCDVRLQPEDIEVIYGYVGAGYSILGDLERGAIRLMAQHEGILLDPVYTGRAFGALVSRLRQGIYAPGETVLFWHTGGAPALFAYSGELVG
jgi:D-cysteine desulfhydrase